MNSLPDREMHYLSKSKGNPLCAVGLHRFDQGLPISICLFTRIHGQLFDLKSLYHRMLKSFNAVG